MINDRPQKHCALRRRVALIHASNKHSAVFTSNAFFFINH